MSVVNMPSTRNLSETELEDVVRLAATLSGRLARVQAEEVGSAVAEALEHIALATRAESCQLLEFSQSGSLEKVYQQARHLGAVEERLPALEESLVVRLSRGEQVAVLKGAPDPRWDADAFSDRARGAAPWAALGVPAWASGQVICALVIHTAWSGSRSQTLAEHLQLLAEILGSLLQRRRQEDALRASLATIEQLNARLEADNVYLKEEIQSYHDFDDIVGESAALRLALTRVNQVAATTSTVLLLGPTGSGKELFARAVHQRSRRHTRPLVRVNCAALPPTLVESELFGHEKGAFTGAIGVRQGRFELADGGTIFLDEIGDLTPDIQVKFLRVLQEGEFERVGSSRTRSVDVRVIAATHHDLERAVAEGRFRADLYYRLSVYPIRLPSLAERRDDIPRLVWFFIHRHRAELGRQITKVPQSVMDALQRYSWPGNVRELENIVERAMIASSGDTLQLDDPLGFHARSTTQSELSDNLNAVQRAHIEAVLRQCSWRINGVGNAAERLGIHPNTLRFRMKKLGVVCPTGRSRPRRPAVASILV
jgi:formate hydrogenlyase transcriptional activator